MGKTNQPEESGRVRTNHFCPACGRNLDKSICNCLSENIQISRDANRNWLYSSNCRLCGQGTVLYATYSSMLVHFTEHLANDKDVAKLLMMGVPK